MSQLQIDAGDYTEELLQFILTELGDKHLDEIEVERVTRRDDAIVGEPITITVILTLGPPLIIGTAKIIEKWLEMRRQKLLLETQQVQLEALKITFEKSPEAAEARQILAPHSGVTVLPE